MNQLCALRHNFFHGLIFALIDDLDVMRVVVYHVGVVGILNFRVGETVSNCQSCKVQGDRVVCRIIVSDPDAMRDCWHVVLKKVHEKTPH